MPNEEHPLLDGVDGARHRRDRNFDWVAQDLVGQARDGRWHGGGEEKVLPLARKLADDATDGIDESHVEHAVGFVEHQGLDIAEWSVPLAHEIDQASWRGDQDIHAPTERRHLGSLRDAAEDHGGLDRQVAPVDAEAFGDLHRELTRGHEHEDARSTLAAARWLGQPV